MHSQFPSLLNVYPPLHSHELTEIEYKLCNKFRVWLTIFNSTLLLTDETLFCIENSIFFYSEKCFFYIRHYRQWHSHVLLEKGGGKNNFLAPPWGGQKKLFPPGNFFPTFAPSGRPNDATPLPCTRMIQDHFNFYPLINFILFFYPPPLKLWEALF